MSLFLGSGLYLRLSARNAFTLFTSAAGAAGGAGGLFAIPPSAGAEARPETRLYRRPGI